MSSFDSTTTKSSITHVIRATDRMDFSTSLRKMFPYSKALCCFKKVASHTFHERQRVLLRKKEGRGWKCWYYYRIARFLTKKVFDSDLGGSGNL